MIHKQKVLAVIPARKNSKGLPGKNIIDLAGKPLLAWTIAAAKKSKYVDQVVVSTDGESIRDIALQYGADVPFMRPAELATDSAPGIGPILHACQQLPDFDLVVVLQPTSPLRTASDIDGAIQELDAGQADFCVSVTQPKHHPNWLFRRNDSGFLEGYDRTEMSTHRQSLEQLFALNGAVYVAKIESLLIENTLIGKKTVAYPMAPERSHDIDTEADLRMCQFLLGGHDE